MSEHPVHLLARLANRESRNCDELDPKLAVKAETLRSKLVLALV